MDPSLSGTRNGFRVAQYVKNINFTSSKCENQSLKLLEKFPKKLKYSKNVATTPLNIHNHKSTLSLIQSTRPLLLTPLTPQVTGSKVRKQLNRTLNRICLPLPQFPQLLDASSQIQPPNSQINTPSNRRQHHLERGNPKKTTATSNNANIIPNRDDSLFILDAPSTKKPPSSKKYTILIPGATRQSKISDIVNLSQPIAGSLGNLQLSKRTSSNGKERLTLSRSKNVYYGGECRLKKYRVV